MTDHNVFYPPIFILIVHLWPGSIRERTATTLDHYECREFMMCMQSKSKKSPSIAFGQTLECLSISHHNLWDDFWVTWEVQKRTCFGHSHLLGKPCGAIIATTKPCLSLSILSLGHENFTRVMVRTLCLNSQQGLITHTKSQYCSSTA